MQISSASSSRSLTHIINRIGHSTDPQGSPHATGLHVEYNPLITEPDDPDSYFPQSCSPPSQPVTSQLEYKEVVRDNVKSFAKLKVDIIISPSHQQFWAFILLRIKIFPSATACLASHILFRVLALRLGFPLSR